MKTLFMGRIELVRRTTSRKENGSKLSRGKDGNALVSPRDRSARGRWGPCPCSDPSCTSAACTASTPERGREGGTDGRRHRDGHVRSFQEEDDEDDGEEVLRRRRRQQLGAGSRSRSRSRPLALLRRQRRRRRTAAVADSHGQRPLGSHWPDPDPFHAAWPISPPAPLLSGSSSSPGRAPPRRRGQRSKSRGAQQPASNARSS